MFTSVSVPESGFHALWHPLSDPDDMVLERTFSGFGRCVCVFLKGPQDHEGVEMGWRRIFDVHKKTVARPFPGGAQKGR